jgi:signal transduction histidine kinase
VATTVACLSGAVLQLFVFFVTPYVNQLYDGWPRGWLIHLLAVLAAFVGGVWSGLTAEAVGIAAIWWKGRYFTPMHPGLEVFALIGVLQILIIHQLQRAHHGLIRRQGALEAARQQAEEARRAAQEANSVKDEFLDMLSHEMRTPLTVILGYCGLARLHGIPTDDQPHVMATIERNASIQLRIVEDLFEVQRLLRGEGTLQCETVDLEGVAAAVVGTLRSAAEEKKVTVASAVEPVTVAGDAVRIRQILWRLLSNAIKFSPEGARVAVSIRPCGDQAVMAVENPGDPIPAHFLPHLFEPFRQADMSTTRAHGGLGLGLAIVKGLVDLHGGSIEVQSDDRRTLFAVRLPRRQPQFS